MKTRTTPKQPGARKRGAAKTSRTARTAEVLGGGAKVSRSRERVPAKWKWHHRVLLSLQGRLLHERHELRRAVAEPVEPHSLDEADSATDEFDHDVALAQLSAEQDALYEVNEALSRIRNGSYGVCEQTGKPIPAARLKAIPWTRFTRELEERLEKEGGAPRARLGQSATVRARGQIWLAPEEAAEELDETPPTTPKDEALSSVFSPPGRHAARRAPAGPLPRAAKSKGRKL